MENIRKLRKCKKISQQELAEKLNVHQTAVSQWESGRTTPDIEVAYKLAEFFNVSVDVILDKADILNNTKKQKLIKDDEPEKSPRRKFLEEQLKDVKFAFAGDDGDYSDDDLELIYQFASMLKQKNEKKEQEKKSTGK